MCFEHYNCQLKLKSFKRIDFKNQKAYEIDASKLQLSEARELASPVGFLSFSPFLELPGHRACFVKDPQETMRENSFYFIRLDPFMCVGEGHPCVGVGRAAVAHVVVT